MQAERPERTRESSQGRASICPQRCENSRGNVRKLEREVDSPVEGREVKLQRGLQRGCSSASSQVSPVDSLPVIGQALVALYVWTDGGGDP